MWEGELQKIGIKTYTQSFLRKYMWVPDNHLYEMLQQELFVANTTANKFMKIASPVLYDHSSIDLQIASK